jgi:hypothetical protein
MATLSNTRRTHSHGRSLPWRCRQPTGAASTGPKQTCPGRIRGDTHPQCCSTTGSMRAHATPTASSNSRRLSKRRAPATEQERTRLLQRRHTLQPLHRRTLQPSKRVSIPYSRPWTWQSTRALSLAVSLLASHDHLQCCRCPRSDRGRQPVAESQARPCFSASLYMPSAHRLCSAAVSMTAADYGWPSRNVVLTTQSAGFSYDTLSARRPRGRSVIETLDRMGPDQYPFPTEPTRTSPRPRSRRSPASRRFHPAPLK